jgi:hypothetical protein
MYRVQVWSESKENQNESDQFKDRAYDGSAGD